MQDIITRLTRYLYGDLQLQKLCSSIFDHKNAIKMFAKIGVKNLSCSIIADCIDQRHHFSNDNRKTVYLINAIRVITNTLVKKPPTQY